MFIDRNYAVDGTAALQAGASPHLIVYCGGAPDSGMVRQTQIASRKRTHGIAVVVVSFAVVVAVALAIAGLDSLRVARGTELVDVAPHETIRVGAGDSLWSLAEEHPVPGVETRLVASWIKDENGLDNSSLKIGESLVVPVLQK